MPQAVWNEVVGQRPRAPGTDALQRATWPRIVDDTALPKIDHALDPGETAAIVLAEALHADLILIDERVGRHVAEARGLTVRGTLGGSSRRARRERFQH